MKNCPNCNAVNSDDTYYCTSCGAAFYPEQNDYQQPVDDYCNPTQLISDNYYNQPEQPTEDYYNQPQQPVNDYYNQPEQPTDNYYNQSEQPADNYYNQNPQQQNTSPNPQQPEPVYNNQQQYQAPAQPVQTDFNEQQLPPQYRPISAWGYFGYSLLYVIPIVGFICLIVFALSNDNINRRNHARSYFCALIIAVIILAIFFVIALITGKTFTHSYHRYYY